MRRSDDRIHTGSLPRPEAVTRLYARRARGEAVDAEEIDAAGLAALRAIVPRQVAAGVDIGNDGEPESRRNSCSGGRSPGGAERNPGSPDCGAARLHPGYGGGA